MVVMDNDVVTPADLVLSALAQAKEPKQLHIIQGGHFEPYDGPLFYKNNGPEQVKFLKEHLWKVRRGDLLVLLWDVI